MEKNKCRIIDGNDLAASDKEGAGESYCNGVPFSNENRGEVKIYRDRKYRRIRKKAS